MPTASEVDHSNSVQQLCTATLYTPGAPPESAEFLFIHPSDAGQGCLTSGGQRQTTFPSR